MRVLIVDDEATLLDLLRRYLEREGYEVHTRATAEEALAWFSGNSGGGETIVITDLSLPAMNGEELVARLRETYPRLRAIITSGYPYQPRQAGVGFLQKPFLPKMLGEAIREVSGGANE